MSRFGEYHVKISDAGFDVKILACDEITPRLLSKAQNIVQREFRLWKSAETKKALDAQKVLDAAAAVESFEAAGIARSQSLRDAAALAAGTAEIRVVDLKLPENDAPEKEETSAEKLARLKAEGTV